MDDGSAKCCCYSWCKIEAEKEVARFARLFIVKEQIYCKVCMAGWLAGLSSTYMAQLKEKRI